MEVPTVPDGPSDCPHCGGTSLASGVRVEPTDAGALGLAYTPDSLLPRPKVEPLLADVCDRCGTVARLYVANPSRRWRTTG